MERTLKPLREGRLTSLEAGALSALERHGPREAEAHDAASAARLAVLERLERAGLVDQVEGPGPRRLAINEKGRAVLAAFDKRKMQDAGL